MLRTKILILALLLLIALTFSGCLGKRTGETADSQQAPTPGTTVPDQDLNTGDLNNIDAVFNDTGSADSIELGVNESTFT